MSETMWTIATLVALIAAYPAMILHDVLRHSPTPTAPAPWVDRGATTGQGVPYVPSVKILP